MSHFCFFAALTLWGCGTATEPPELPKDEQEGNKYSYESDTAYLEYLVLLRLDKQADFYYLCYHYLNGDEDFSAREFMAMTEGANIFIQDDFLDGAYEIVYGEDCPEFIRGMGDSADLDFDKIKALNLEDRKRLGEIYKELSTLYNRVEKETLAWYIAEGEYNSAEFKAVEEKTKGLEEVVRGHVSIRTY